MSARYDITFLGRVQGVGFRYTTERIARRFPGVAGWVRNERDGTVRCVLEGDESELDAFLDSVKQAMMGFIAETRLARLESTGEFDRFEIRH